MKSLVRFFTSVHLGVIEAAAVPPVVLLHCPPHDVRMQSDAAVQVRRTALGHTRHVEVGDAVEDRLVRFGFEPARVFRLGNVALWLLHYARRQNIRRC